MPRPYEVAAAYFEENPDLKGDVVKAYYAYHDGYAPGSQPPSPADELREQRHAFVDAPGTSGREACCRLCGRARWEVRWDDLPAPCSGRPAPEGIATTICEEEERFLAMLDKAPALVAKHVPDPDALSGERLAWLHHTHGLSPDVVEGALDRTLPEALHDAYLEAMEQHRAAS